MINNILHSRALPVYGDGKNIRDWLWVKDHAAAIDIIYHKGSAGETYNVGGNQEYTNIDLVYLLCDTMDRELNRQEGTSRDLITFVKDRPGHDRRYAIDASKIKQDLGWEPSLDLKEGLKKTVDWYLNHSDWLKHVTSGEYLKYYQKQYE